MKSIFQAVLIVVFLLPTASTYNMEELGSAVNLQSCCWAWDGSYPSNLGNVLGKSKFFPSDGRVGGNEDPAILDQSTVTKYMILIVLLLITTVSMMLVFVRKEL